MGTEHLPALPQTGQVSKDSYWTSSHSKFVLRAGNKETKVEGGSSRRTRGSFTRRLPPLESKVPAKSTPDSGFSDPGNLDDSCSKEDPSRLPVSSDISSRLSQPKATQSPLYSFDQAESLITIKSQNPLKVTQDRHESDASTKPVSQTRTNANSSAMFADNQAAPQPEGFNPKQAKTSDSILGSQMMPQASEKVLQRTEDKQPTIKELNSSSEVPDKPKVSPKVSMTVISIIPVERTSINSTAPDERTPINSTAPDEKAPVKSTAPTEKAPVKSTAPTEKAPVKSTAPTEKTPVKSAPQFEKKSINSAAPVEKAPDKSTAQTEKTPVKSTIQFEKKPINSTAPVEKAPDKSTVSFKKAPVKTFSFVTNTSVSKAMPSVDKKPTKNSSSIEKMPPSKRITAALKAPKRRTAGAKRTDEKALPVAKRAAVRRMPVRKTAQAKIDTGVKRGPTRRLPLLQDRKHASSDRNSNNRTRPRKERLVFDRDGKFVLRKDRPPVDAASKRGRYCRPPGPQDLRRRYLGREAPRQATRKLPPPPPPPPPKQAQLSRREAGQWRRMHRKFGVEPTIRRRVIRHDRFLRRVEAVQLKAALQHNEALAERARRRERSKWRQAAQLWKVRDRFREEQRDRCRRQWVTPKTVRHDTVDRRLYGLPENELAPVLASTPPPTNTTTTTHPRKAPIERFDYVERRRANVRLYAAHLGLDSRSHAWDRGDAKMPQVRPAARVSTVAARPHSGKPWKQRVVTKEVKAEVRKQDESVEVSASHQSDRDRALNGHNNSDRPRDRRIYQANSTQSQQPHSLKDRRQPVPMTTRTVFATRVTANAQKQRAQANGATRQKFHSNPQQPPQLPKREKVLGSLASLRTVDFLDDDPELDNFDAFDKARIKYNIDIDSLDGENNT